MKWIIEDLLGEQWVPRHSRNGRHTTNLRGLLSAPHKGIRETLRGGGKPDGEILGYITYRRRDKHDGPHRVDVNPDKPSGFECDRCEPDETTCVDLVLANLDPPRLRVVEYGVAHPDPAPAARAQVMPEGTDANDEEGKIIEDLKPKMAEVRRKRIRRRDLPARTTSTPTHVNVHNEPVCYNVTLSSSHVRISVGTLREADRPAFFRDFREHFLMGRPMVGASHKQTITGAQMARELVASHPDGHAVEHYLRLIFPRFDHLSDDTIEDLKAQWRNRLNENEVVAELATHRFQLERTKDSVDGTWLYPKDPKDRRVSIYRLLSLSPEATP